MGVQLTTPGMPSIYYGTEQAFDGTEDYHDYSIEPQRFAGDRYIRGRMFGGAFGVFGTAAAILRPRSSDVPADPCHRTAAQWEGRCRPRDRRGRVYPRIRRFLAIRLHSLQGELVAWSMMHFETEVVMALNTNATASRGAEVTIDVSSTPTVRR